MTITRSTMAFAACAAAAPLAFGQAQNLVGVTQVTVQPNADAVVAVPYVLESEGTFEVDGTPTGDTVAVDPATPIANGEFGSTFFVRFTTGAAAGLKADVVSSGVNSITLDVDVQALGVTDADSFEIFPHQTLETALPDDRLGLSFEASSTNIFGGVVAATTVRLYDPAVDGTNQSTAATFAWLDGEWVDLAGNNADDTIVPQNAAIVVRNTNMDRTLSFVAAGKVETTNVGRAVSTLANTDDDIYVSTGLPVTVELRELGLGGTAAFADSTTNIFGGIVAADTLRVFDNSVVGETNKSTAATYVFLNGQWQDLSGNNADAVEIGAGEGFVIRKQQGTADTNVWSVPERF